MSFYEVDLGNKACPLLGSVMSSLIFWCAIDKVFWKVFDFSVIPNLQKPAIAEVLCICVLRFPSLPYLSAFATSYKILQCVLPETGRVFFQGTSMQHPNEEITLFPC